MKKRVNFTIIITLFLLLGLNRINALECKYSGDGMNATFTINESKETVSKATLKGVLTTSDDGLFESDGKRDVDETEPVNNWKSKYDGIDAKGVDYFHNHGKCPPYAFLVDDWNGFTFAVFTESHKQSFIDLGKSKQGYAIMALKEEVKPPTTTGSDVSHVGSSCMAYTTKQACEKNDTFSCVWNETEHGNYCNVDTLLYVRCGSTFDIPNEVPALISLAVNLLKVATPIILIVVSIITLMKALASSKEDEIKKAQSSLIKKIIAAVMVFFVISIVQFVVSKVADNADKDDLNTCLSCFLNNDCQKNLYYKTNVKGTWLCKDLVSGEVTTDCH